MWNFLFFLSRTPILAYAASKVSPALSGTNNSTLVVTAVVLKRLKESGEAIGFKFKGIIDDMCTRCNLTFNTMEHHVEVVHLMLRLNVAACLLPFFCDISLSASCR
jgi:hypothetical protein